MCDQDTESIDHLLITCPFARSLWFEVLAAWGNPEWTPTPDDVLLDWCTSLTPTLSKRKDWHTTAIW